MERLKITDEERTAFAEWAARDLGTVRTSMRKRRSKRARRPAGHYTQGHRLIALYDRLRRGDTLRAPDLAAELGLSRRTIERDIGVLDDVLGDAIMRHDEPGVGIVRRLAATPRAFSTTPGQLLAIALGARLASFLEGDRFHVDVAPLLEQLRQALPPGERRRVRGFERKVVVVAPGQKDYTAKPALLKHLSVVVDAILFERPFQLHYASHQQRTRGAQARALTVHPLAFVVYRAGVYFVVDVVSGETAGLPPRILLALDRIVDAAPVADSHFDYPAGFVAEDFFGDAYGLMDDGPARDVRVRIDARMAPFVAERRWHEPQTIVQNADGSIEVKLQVTGMIEVADWVMSLGEHAEVLAPRSLGHEVHRRLAAAVEKYTRAT